MLGFPVLMGYPSNSRLVDRRSSAGGQNAEAIRIPKRSKYQRSQHVGRIFYYWMAHLLPPPLSGQIFIELKSDTKVIQTPYLESYPSPILFHPTPQSPLPYPSNLRSVSSPPCLILPILPYLIPFPIHFPPYFLTSERPPSPSS